MRFDSEQFVSGVNALIEAEMGTILRDAIDGADKFQENQTDLGRRGSPDWSGIYAAFSSAMKELCSTILEAAETEVASLEDVTPEDCEAVLRDLELVIVKRLEPLSTAYYIAILNNPTFRTDEWSQLAYHQIIQQKRALQLKLNDKISAQAARDKGKADAEVVRREDRSWDLKKSLLVAGLSAVLAFGAGYFTKAHVDRPEDDRHVQGQERRELVKEVLPLVGALASTIRRGDIVLASGLRSRTKLAEQALTIQRAARGFDSSSGPYLLRMDMAYGDRHAIQAVQMFGMMYAMYYGSAAELMNQRETEEYRIQVDSVSWASSQFDVAVSRLEIQLRGAPH